MNIKELEYFKTVCQHKSITKAAHALYMTPQGLSKIIKNIESEMGASLLNRTGTGISLTEAGAYLYAKLPEFLNLSLIHIWRKTSPAVNTKCSDGCRAGSLFRKSSARKKTVI